ncbi:MAG: FAD-dependent oxidoreductase [Deltaproteobacteria bacterium]|nr:FAD-dependent oxidoreductase [Deltaproteobacteria bacterium]
MNGVSRETDIVVIGSGVSGLSAAVTAADEGLKVMVFEKQRSFGGTSNFFEGIFAVESDMQRERYIDYTRDQAFKNIMEYGHWKANARLVRAYVDQTAETVDWLRERGVEFLEVTINIPNAPRGYHRVRGGGAAVVKALVERAKEKGAVLKSGTPVVKILREGKAITGVIAEEEGEEISIKAKVVVIGSGGYANNKQWIKKYAGFDLDVNMIPIGNVDKMGDGIRMAWEVGADEEGMGVLEVYRVGPLSANHLPKNQIECVALQPDLWVDPQGRRFCDEAIGFTDTSVGNANARYREGFTYSLFDDSIIQRIMDRGIDKNVAYENPVGSKPVNFFKELEAGLEKGSKEVMVADSLDDLAEKMGVDPDVLKKEVEVYNEFCRKRHDALFAKNPRYLHPLTGPKFYAVKARNVFLGTIGGIKINESTEVVDKKSRVIPGLYAAGFDAGGLWGDSYGMNVCSGTCASFAINSGRIAGKNAVKYIKKK